MHIKNIIYFILFIILARANDLCAQDINRFKFQFDSSYVFQEKIIIPIDRSSILKDSSVVIQLDSLRYLLDENPKLVVVLFLYYDFDRYQNIGFNSFFHNARTTIEYLGRKGIDTRRIRYEAPYRTRYGVRNENLISKNQRIEYFIYKKPEK